MSASVMRRLPLSLHSAHLMKNITCRVAALTTVLLGLAACGKTAPETPQASTPEVGIVTL